jgi:hypothetical protein
MHYQTLTNLLKNLSLDGVCRRSLKGAEVFYTAGAQVLRVELPTDFSAIQIFGSQETCKPQKIQDLLSALGFNCSTQDLHIKALEEDVVVVDIKVKDPHFAKKFVTKFNSTLKNSAEGRFRIQELRIGNPQGPLSANRLQKSTVICSWSKASCIAWLHYSSMNSACTAHQILARKDTILGRKLECKVQGLRSSNPGTKALIQVGNLDPLTSIAHFGAILHGANAPDRIVFGKPSHPLSDLEAENTVKELLVKEGLESWEPMPASGTFRAKGTARFRSSHMASEAVRKLHNTKLVALADSKLFLSHITSVKLSKLTGMFKVLEKDIANLGAHRQHSGHTNIKPYPPAQGSNPYTVIRISGEDSKAVAEAKGAVERLLSGTIAEKNGVMVWDAYFTTAPGLAYLRNLYQKHNAYIYRDARFRRLAIYGPENTVKVINEALVQRVEALSELKHTIVLDHELYQKAFSGGWRAIFKKFPRGAATLDVNQHLMTITIRGSQADFENARALLVMDHSNSVKLEYPELTCVVCWNEAVNPYKTTCQHTYCAECFISQCDAAGDEEVQICCYGDEGQCQYVFPIMELEKALPSTNFERLLDASFTAYVRTHPNDFQYCPTPDCIQVYRLSTASTTFDCPQCLASICTCCGVISHDGMTCAAYKQLVSEGMFALNEWKKENDVRDCPKCKAPIQKISGCNHMVCGGCQIDICWTCMKTFISGQDCYGHMQIAHGSFV